MATVTLTYQCPVYVEVDTNTGEVDRVVVDDEHCGLAGNGDPERPSGKPVSPKLAARALSIAENGEWPSWELGC